MKKQNSIAKQLLVFALIAAIFNIYALEFWCSLLMGSGHHQTKTAEHIHVGNIAPHDHHPETATAHSHQKLPIKPEPKCPHQGDSEETDNCCQDQKNLLFTIAASSGIQKFSVIPAPILFLKPENLFLQLSFTSAVARETAGFFPDVGLKPKIPDIRVYICSLTI